jgi:uncharacterized protein YprB with RNaseH-like and TPR domain
MANLRDRLRRIQEYKNEASQTARPPSERQPSAHPPPADVSFFREQGWDSCGYLALRRELTVETQAQLKAPLPHALMILVPDLARIAAAGRGLPEAEDLLFFDLETTGLSGGAGTVAFLAAFGRFARAGNGGGAGLLLRITQYLLLDYPGENDFLEALLGEFGGKQQVVVSYNGKCFDSQILKTRCLLNAIHPPCYHHVDLLHPARRLWKSVLEDCSQKTIETNILGLQREGDIPGALAPEIWFDFLKTGETERLTGICDHNCRDIAGLASIFAAMSHIAADPYGSTGKYRYDLQRLALAWRDFTRQTGRDASIDCGWHGDLRKIGEELLCLAAEKNYPGEYSRAAYLYALDQLRAGNFGEGRNRLLNIAACAFPQNAQAAALRALAIDSERRLGNNAQALEFTAQALELEQMGEAWRGEFQRRKQRLEKKGALR